MISPECVKCKEELDDFGAIMLGPPDLNGKVPKFHVCRSCHRAWWYGWVLGLPCTCYGQCCRVHDTHSMPHKGCMLR